MNYATRLFLMFLTQWWRRILKKRFFSINLSPGPLFHYFLIKDKNANKCSKPNLTIILTDIWHSEFDWTIQITIPHSEQQRSTKDNYMNFKTSKTTNSPKSFLITMETVPTIFILQNQHIETTKKEKMVKSYKKKDSQFKSLHLVYSQNYQTLQYHVYTCFNYYKCPLSMTLEY